MPPIGQQFAAHRILDPPLAVVGPQPCFPPRFSVYVRSMAYHKLKLKCPDCRRVRPHYAKGLCEACWRKAWWRGYGPAYRREKKAVDKAGLSVYPASQ